MNFEEFIAFVDKTIDELVLYAQMHAGMDFSEFELSFKWEMYGASVVKGRENIVLNFPIQRYP